MHRIPRQSSGLRKSQKEEPVHELRVHRRGVALGEFRIIDQVMRPERKDRQNERTFPTHALSLCVILVTNSTRAFARVMGLQVEHWV